MRSGRGPTRSWTVRDGRGGCAVELRGAAADLDGAPALDPAADDLVGVGRWPAGASASARSLDSANGGSSCSSAPVGERLVAGPDGVVLLAGAQRLLAAGELLVEDLGRRRRRRARRRRSRSCGDRRRPRRAGSGDRRRGARSAGRACRRTAPRRRPSPPPGGDAGPPGAALPRCGRRRPARGPLALACRLLVLFLAYGVSCRARAEERRYADRHAPDCDSPHLHWVPRFPSGSRELSGAARTLTPAPAAPESDRAMC